MKDIKGFDPLNPELICPMRKSGGPCVEDVCAWWHENECSVLSVSKSMYALEKVIQEHLSGKRFPEAVERDDMNRPLAIMPARTRNFLTDDDVPF